VKCAQQQEEICILRQKVAVSSKQTSSSDSSSQVVCVHSLMDTGPIYGAAMTPPFHPRKKNASQLVQSN